MELTEDIARRFAQVALGHVTREYPNKLDHVMASAGDAQTPRQLHPCFFGSFDWHSCVHSWWTLLTIKRLFPETSEAGEIAALANGIFTEANCAAELAYAQRPESKSFERPYGWGWYFYLHREAERHDAQWAARLEPLANHFAALLKEYLKVLTYPITVGTHYNTAFALVLAREWALDRDPELVAAIDSWSIRCFADCTDYRGWEPGGDEFLSPSLTVALLMSEVLEPRRYSAWLDTFLPPDGWIADLVPATVSDRSDGKIAHLDGLNLSRAWCLWGAAGKLEGNSRVEELHQLAESHFNAAINHIADDYAGAHWLTSFALLALLVRNS